MARKKTYVDCTACWSRVPEAEAEEHRKTPICKAMVVVREFDEKGWVPIDGARAKIIKDTSIPWKEALGGVHHEEIVTGKEEKGSIRRLKTRIVEKRHKVMFAPRGAMRVLAATSRMPTIDRQFRRRMLEALWDQGDDILTQIDTVKRLDGNVRSYLWRLVIAAEEAKGTGKNDEGARVLVDGIDIQAEADARRAAAG